MSEYKKLVALQSMIQTLAPELPKIEIDGQAFGMDYNDLGSFSNIGDQSKLTPIANQILSEGSLAFFAAQTFIGYQVAALIAQNWLVNKACTQKIRDAAKPWYIPTINDGSDVDADVIAKINKLDKRYGLKRNLIEAGRFNNVFGIRHVLFDIEGIDYEKPFNADGITPGSYKGIIQIDPYWVTPFFKGEDVSQPATRNFYNPTHWYVSGRGKIHRSHFVILRGPEVADYIKPAYYYGGLGLPQLIFERAYASERTANEAPQVAMSKRLNVRKVDMEKVVADPSAFQEAMAELTQFRDNFGVHVIDKDEEHQQFDTSLTDFDATIMTQYQLCAAISNTPATKLMGTSPKGFNATGEFEMDSYHEELESVQEMDFDPIIERHHICMMRSDIAPEFKELFEIDIVWNPLKVESRKEKAEINEINARRDAIYVDAGVVSQEEVRERLIADEDSGYDGLESIDQGEIQESFGLPDIDLDPESELKQEVETSLEPENGTTNG